MVYIIVVHVRGLLSLTCYVAAVGHSIMEERLQVGLSHLCPGETLPFLRSYTIRTPQALLQAAAAQQPQLLDTLRAELASQLGEASSGLGLVLAEATSQGGSASPAAATLLQVTCRPAIPLLLSGIPRAV